MGELSFIPATENDIPFINAVYNENIDSLHGVKRTDDVWKELLSGKDEYYIVNAEVPVAWFRTEAEDGVFWLSMLQVMPIYKRKGIGKYVLSVVEDIAKAAGYRKIGIHTTEDNTAARGLYVSAGYGVTEVGPCTTADGERRVGYTFVKEI